MRQYLLRTLASEDAVLVVTPGILHEFLHVTTDPRRFEPPLTMAEATAVVRLYLGRSNVECIGADEAALARALDLMDAHRLGRERIADALFAATLLEHGVTELVTCDPRGFAVFDQLRLIDPRAG